MFRNDIRARLSAVMLLLLLLPMLGLGLIGRNALQTSLYVAETDELNIRSTGVADFINGFVEDNLSLVTYAATNEAIVRWAAAPEAERGNYQAAADAQLRQLVEAKGIIEATSVLDLRGIVVLDQVKPGLPDGRNVNNSDREWFQVARSGRAHVSLPLISQATKQLVIQFAAPVYNRPGGQVTAVLRIRVNNSVLENELQKLVQEEVGGVQQGDINRAVAIALVDREGIIFLDSKNLLAYREAGRSTYRSIDQLTPAQIANVKQVKRFGTDAVEITPLQLSQNFRDNFGTGKEVSAFQYEQDGRSYYASVGTIESAGWRVITEVPETAFSAPIRRETQSFLLFGLIIAALALGVIILVARQITRPIVQMERAASQVANGNYAARLPVRGNDQLASLGRTVNGMVDQITTTAQTQTEQNEAMQRQIIQLLEETSTVAEGDLTVEAEVSADALGAVADSFNHMIVELRRIIGGVNAASAQVAASTDEILATTDVLNRAAEQQAARIADTSTAVEEMAVSIQQVSENAALSARVAREARASAEAGTGAVAATVAGMGRIRDQVQETGRKIERLEASSQEIGSIVALIRDVADQTTVLALNAAIRAAAAGEHGKGFAVVAEEVRRLAERTTAASGQIEALVRGIQAETSEAIAAMADGTREVVADVALADEAGRALARIDATSTQLAELIEAISLAAEQQARASAGIARAMGEISGLTTGTTAGTQQAAASVAALAALADDLRSGVATFRLGQEADEGPLGGGHATLPARGGSRRVAALAGVGD